MKSYFLAILGIAAALCSCSVSQSPQMTSMVFHGTLMMDQSPIRVIEYREFLFHQPAEQRQMLVPFQDKARAFLNDTRNLELPVKGINGEQAWAFCRWRSQVWNQKGDGNRYRFRLPTVEEMRESPWAFGDTTLQRELAVSDGGVVALGHGLEAPNIATVRGSAVGFRCMAEIVPLPGS